MWKNGGNFCYRISNAAHWATPDLRFFRMEGPRWRLGPILHNLPSPFQPPAWIGHWPYNIVVNKCMAVCFLWHHTGTPYPSNFRHFRHVRPLHHVGMAFSLSKTVWLQFNAHSKYYNTSSHHITVLFSKWSVPRRTSALWFGISAALTF